MRTLGHAAVQRSPHAVWAIPRLFASAVGLSGIYCGPPHNGAAYTSLRRRNPHVSTSDTSDTSDTSTKAHITLETLAFPESLDAETLARALAQELGLKPGQTLRTLELLDGGNTVPFIARYRKEATSNLD